MAKSLTSSGHVAAGKGDYLSPELLDFMSRLIGDEEASLHKIRMTTVKKGLPPISIGPLEGRILEFLVRACGARRAVEVGSLAGYSACWIARALPEGGRLHTLEYEPRYAEVARENIRAAGFAEKVTVHVGRAADTLPSLEASGPFDFCFIDADKVGYPHYIEWALRHVRPGGMVVGDNVFLFGKLHLESSQAGADGPSVPAMRKFLSVLSDPAHFSACAIIPTGEGMAVAIKK